MGTKRDQPAPNTDEMWYHSGVHSRDEATSVLTSSGLVEGLFLVRPSSSAKGDFVLSVVHEGEVIHYQIRRRGEDAIFSLSEEQKVIHGLDELIYHYRYNKHTGLQHSLGEFVPGDFCLASDRLHGSENLLHRATVAGNVDVVRSMLSCGYQNLSAKNHDGQSAVHLASFYGHEEVLETLLEFCAPVNVVDSSGYTPLHFSCQNDQPGAARILLNSGSANPTLRNQITDWAPLHEAAWKGHERCARVLLDANAPSKARTRKNETPADLARTAGFHALAEIINEWDDYTEYGVLGGAQGAWLHGPIPREEAIMLLKSKGCKDGTFLIRKRRERQGVHVLSLLHDAKIYHFEVIKQGIYFFLDQGPYLLSLAHVVDHYSRFSDGLPCSLKIPVAQPAPAPAPRLTLRPNDQRRPCNLKSVEPSGRPYVNSETLERVRKRKELNVPSQRIQRGPMIGEGEFGSVYEGRYEEEGENGGLRKVAIKVLNETNQEEFFSEVEVMTKLDHRCIVQMIGVCRDANSVMMILELAPLGSLLNFLLTQPDSCNPNWEFPIWASQVASGMHYLQTQGFVHRDLAARNILLASKFQAKISDFGLSRIVGDTDFYTSVRGGRWPMKWYAPECVKKGTFSTQSDVWSFGVLLWEMYSYGSQPYDGMTGHEAVTHIDQGHRLPQPERAEYTVYRWMQDCWEVDPRNRPNFKELGEFFSENPEYVNMRELLVYQDLQELGLGSVAVASAMGAAVKPLPTAPPAS